MCENAESHSSSVPYDRNCTVEIVNLSSVYCLVNPKVYMKSGFAYSPPQPTIRSSRTEVCSFTKEALMPKGTVGVLTYQMFDMGNRSCSELLAVMFSVPYDYNVFKNWLGVGIFEHTRGCDKKLYKLMYSATDFTQFVRQESNGSVLKYAGKAVDVRACMSDSAKAIIKLELSDRMCRCE